MFLLDQLPNEIHERIFLFADNPSLSLVNQLYFRLSADMNVRLLWLIHHYGKEDALTQCWKYKYLWNEECECVTQFNEGERRECALEAKQWSIVQSLLEQGCNPSPEGHVPLSLAIRLNHLKLVEGLLSYGANPNIDPMAVPLMNYGPSHLALLEPPSLSVFSKRRFLPNALMFSLRLHHPSLLSILVKTQPHLSRETTQVNLLEDVESDAETIHEYSQLPNQNTTKLHKYSLTNALTEAALKKQINLARILVEEGKAVTDYGILVHLFQKALGIRILLGGCQSYDPILTVLIQGLSPFDFSRMQGYLLRSSAEVGCLHAFKMCAARHADVNIWDGFPLYASVYSGNPHITQFLLSEHSSATLDYFRGRQVAFCVLLLTIEALAFTMFFFLGYLYLSQDQTQEDSWATFNSMLVAAVLALGVMYRLVPFHKVCQALLLVKRKQRQRMLSV
jgi:hypothetical protein